MTLRLYDTRRGGLHPFEPIPGRDSVGLYVCGVTPYDTGHLGHAFTYVSFDVLHRYLEYLGHDVVYVQNLTDVDDDMLRKARETGEDYLALGNRWVTTFLTEMAGLNWLPPDHLPRATQHVPQMIVLIERLLDAGLAYASDGHVYFRVAADPRLRRGLACAERGDARDRQRARQRARTCPESAIPSTSSSGSARCPTSPPGSRRGVRGVRDGTSSVPRCR